jgi:L-2-hydroxyglutarate oxidase LhgO
MLYDICAKYNIGHRRLGKVIVAADEAETRELEHLYRQGIENGITDLSMLTRVQVKSLEPLVEAVAGLLSPSTGIIDAHGLMRSFYGRARESGADFLFGAGVTGIEKQAGGYLVTARRRGELMSVMCGLLINCAGLFADRVAAMAGIDIDAAGYRLGYAKGEYFAIDPRAGHLVDRLVYPVPEQAGKGIHISVNLEGHMKLGPNVKWVDNIDYTVEEADRELFYRAAHRYLPVIKLDYLSPDFAGVRPKLQKPGEDFRDYVIAHEADKGLPGLINLVGIESPGLTSSPAIARYVAGVVKGLL